MPQGAAAKRKEPVQDAHRTPDGLLSATARRGIHRDPVPSGARHDLRRACRPGKKNWWDALHYQIRISALQEQGYLVALRAKEAENIDGDLESVRTDKGEYNTADLARLMEKEVHVGSAVNAYRRYGEGRKHVVVFAVTISHAEKLAGAFTAAGFPLSLIHI